MVYSFDLRRHWNSWSRELSNKAELEARYPNMDKRFLFVNLGYNLRPMEISGQLFVKHSFPWQTFARTCMVGLNVTISPEAVGPVLCDHTPTTRLLGAIGIKQMERLPHMNSVRNENHDRIEAALKASPLFNGQLDFVEVHDKAVPAWFGFSCLINSRSKIMHAAKAAPSLVLLFGPCMLFVQDWCKHGNPPPPPSYCVHRYAHQHTEFLEYLTERGIENRPIISGNFARQPGLELLDLEVKGEDFPGAESIGLRGFFFGVHTTPLTENQVQYLVDTILGFKWNPRNIVLVTGGSGLVGKAMQAQIANDSSIM